jgi:hypothetical protein
MEVGEVSGNLRHSRPRSAAASLAVSKRRGLLLRAWRQQDLVGAWGSASSMSWWSSMV